MIMERSDDVKKALEEMLELSRELLVLSTIVRKDNPHLADKLVEIADKNIERTGKALKLLVNVLGEGHG